MPVSLLWFGEKMNLNNSDSTAHALKLQHWVGQEILEFKRASQVSFSHVVPSKPSPAT